MQSGQIGYLRQQKIELYRSLLPPGALPIPGGGLLNDADFADTLLHICRIAPPSFGLIVGSNRKLSELGVLGHVSLSCSTLREVVELWMLYAKNAGELVNLRVDASCGGAAGTCSIEIVPMAGLPRQVADLLVDEMSTALFRYGFELTGKQLSGFETRLPHARVKGTNYQPFFPGPVTFDHETCVLVGSAATLELSVVPARATPLSLSELSLDRLDMPRPGAISLRVYEFFVNRREHTPTLAAAAAAMNISVRSLVRHLAAEGTTYGTLLDDFRSRYAVALARYGGLKAKQIAHLVGFRSENGLRKAFKKWTGQSIGSWHDRPPS